MGCGVFGTGATQDVFHSCATLPSFRLRLEICSTILHSWSTQDLKSLELIPSGPTAFFRFDAPEFFPHLVCCEGQIGAPGLDAGGCRWRALDRNCNECAEWLLNVVERLVGEGQYIGGADYGNCSRED